MTGTRRKKYRFLATVSSVISFYLLIQLFQTPVWINPALNVIDGDSLQLLDKKCYSSSKQYLEPFRYCTEDMSLRISLNNAFELSETKLILGALQNYPGSYLIDIGANVGLFSVQSALRGHDVIAVDASRKNLQYLHTNAVMNRVSSKVSLVHNAVSDIRTFYYAAVPAGNVHTMEVKMVKSNQDLTMDDRKSMKVIKGEKINSVTLLDILRHYPSISDTVIVKIDIEGYECKALHEFLQMAEKPVYIPYILMEWKFISDPEQQKVICPEFESLIKGFENSDFQPFSPELLSSQELREYEIINVFWKHAAAKDVPFLTELRKLNVTL